MLFVCQPKILHKYCLQFLLGVKMAPRENENNAYAKFWGDKQRALWYVMVFSGVVNCSDCSDHTCIFSVMSAPSVKIICNKFCVVISNENNRPLHRSLLFFCSFHSFSCSICILSSKDTCSRINEVRTCVSLTMYWQLTLRTLS